ncbi:MAG TPA: selenocysteine-specific translation elongation factor [Burkholderiales bacterium]|nr:selenocysteine-specific translation elongation factor [Burkholderiales bacterium]
MIIGTAGHIDHGKTSLVKALTGVDADRLPQEKARGMTLDLGYAYLPLPDGQVLGFVDVPGHEKLVRNMLAGATGIDYALLVVAADDGPMPQTREHLELLTMLDIDRGAVALTKIDKIGAQRIEHVQAQLHALLASSSLAAAPIFPVSNIAGEGVEALRAHLAREVAHGSARSRAGYFRLAIDRCFNLSGVGTVVTGTVHSGSVAVGDTVVLTPPGVKVRVRSLHAQNQPASKADAGQRCALNIAGADFDASQIERGYWLVAPRIHAPTTRIDVWLQMSATAPRALAHWTSVHFHLGTEEVMGRVALLEGEQLGAGKAGLAQIVLDRPIGALHGDRFVIRDQSAMHTLGGGKVLDPFPPARGRRTQARLALLRSWTHADARQALQEALAHHAVGTDLERFAMSWSIAEDELVTTVRQIEAHVLGGIGERWAVAADAWSQLRQRASSALAAEHERAPDMIGVGRERLRRLAVSALPQLAYQALVEELLASGEIERSGMWLRAPGHRVQLSANERILWEQVYPHLAENHFHPPRVRDLARARGVDENVMRQLLNRVTRLGDVYLVAHDHYFTLRAVERLADVVRAIAATHGEVTAAVFRDQIGTGRKLAIQILEFFDRIGFTRRVKDGHRLRQPDLFSANTAEQA